MYLDWKVVDVLRHQTYSRPAGHTFCNFGKGSTQKDVMVLQPGQRLELGGIRIPEDFLRPEGKGLYRISLRHSPRAFILPEDILQELHYNLTSNEMTVVFREY